MTGYANQLEFQPEKHIVLTANQNTGFVSRLIELRSTYDVDRPWISWIDEGNRHVTATGYHTRLIDALGGDILKQYEVKTIASASGPNPADLRTRFAIQCDVERGTWGVNYIDNFEINQAENPLTTTPGAITPAGLRIRLAPADTAATPSTTVVCATFQVQLDASDNVSGFLDVNVPYLTGVNIPGTRTATLNIFRNTNTGSASSPQLAIKKGDGTNTNALLFTARSGKFELPLALSGTTGIVLGADSVATLYRSAASTIKTDGNILTVGAVGTKVKAGTPVDGDVTTPVDGMIIADSSGSKIWVRLGGAWKGVAVA